ncbi:MAG: FtsK/SpoIIIE domain-containing protein [Polyangiaceae bacterium]
MSAPKPPIVGPTLYLIEVSKLRGAVSQLDRAAEDVSHRLASADGTDARYRKVGSLRRFEIVRAKPRRVTLAPLLQSKRDWLRARPGRFIVGVTPSGEVVTGDFSDAGTPHVLVAGQTGSGKSVFVQSVLASLVYGHGPDAIRFTLVDPKRVTFASAAFRASISRHLDGPIRFDAADAVTAAESLVAMMEERYALFERAGVIDVDEYNADLDGGRRLERRVLVVDEFSDLTADKGTAKAFEGAIARLGAKARAAGIHLLLATQRPDAKVVSGTIKANLTGRIALAVRDVVNSRIILDEPGAEQLLGKGDLLAQLGHGLVRAQGALLA